MTMTKQQQPQQIQQSSTAAAPAATTTAAPGTLAHKSPANASSSAPKITFAAAAAQAAMSSSESTSNTGTAGSMRRVSVTMKKNGDYSVAIAEGDVASVNLKTSKPAPGGTRDKVASGETLGSLTRSTAAISISSTPPTAQSSPASAAASVLSGGATHAKLHSSLPQLPTSYPSNTGFSEMRRRTIGGPTPSPPRMGGGGGLVSGSSFNSLPQHRSTSSMGLPLTPMRRRASTNMSVMSQASNGNHGGMSGLTPALASAAATYTQSEIYSFLLVSKELAAAADFLCQLLHLGGLHDEILLSEFKTILVDLMAERFSEIWDIRQPGRGAGFRTLGHAPNMPQQHVDPLLQTAFVLCNMHPKHLSTLLPVSFTLTIAPGLVAYTTADVAGFQPVHLFEARPYLPPRHQEPVDHGAEIRMRAQKSIEMGQVSLDNFDLDDYFGGAKDVPARRPSLSSG